ncbi:hypothetical protein PFICI_10988 [Pestalotiopsis fici W106-1]|uniref:Uncharacterized protein n=1 Tax=Pestalotiopsis fici (strain W106-1 / CGMCC3.15140) TaxID=1229662 RepID=W3WTH7_PESFW|nr:uncharacterized protein PFICI_10988 [Pestalotiopsis fici W106-1]ETS77114.1 hypothetical protein PFICI_10988 [Pestalotiopsis fici W106-1]
MRHRGLMISNRVSNATHVSKSLPPRITCVVITGPSTKIYAIHSTSADAERWTPARTTMCAMSATVPDAKCWSFTSASAGTRTSRSMGIWDMFDPVASTIPEEPMTKPGPESSHGWVRCGKEQY